MKGPSIDSSGNISVDTAFGSMEFNPKTGDAKISSLGGEYSYNIHTGEQDINGFSKTPNEKGELWTFSNGPFTIGQQFDSFGNPTGELVFKLGGSLGDNNEVFLQWNIQEREGGGVEGTFDSRGTLFGIPLWDPSAEPFEVTPGDLGEFIWGGGVLQSFKKHYQQLEDVMSKMSTIDTNYLNPLVPIPNADGSGILIPIPNDDGSGELTPIPNHDGSGAIIPFSFYDGPSPQSWLSSPPPPNAPPPPPTGGDPLVLVPYSSKTVIKNKKIKPPFSLSSQ